MPKDLVRQVETTRKEIATYDFAGMDNKSLQQSHALRQAAASLRARGPTYDMMVKKRRLRSLARSAAATERAKKSQRSQVHPSTGKKTISKTVSRGWLT